MKILFFLILIGAIIIFSISTMMEHSEAQSSIPSNQLLSDSEVFIFVQTIVEDSDGHLVTYLASDKFTDLNLDALDILIEAEKSEKDPIIVIDDQKFQVIQRLKRVNHNQESVVASTTLVHDQNGDTKLIARFAHDGYPLQKGEIITSAWTFIIPVD